MIDGATFSPCRAYRYTLRRSWGDGSIVSFIGLNPSTADETNNDPTIRRCIGFAKAWGYAGLIMLNLFAFRSTKPRDMLMVDDPIGPENDRYLRLLIGASDLAIAAWGVRGNHRGRAAYITETYSPWLHVLRLTKGGHPEHPLYLPGDLRPVPLVTARIAA